MRLPRKLSGGVETTDEEGYSYFIYYVIAKIKLFHMKYCIVVSRSSFTKPSLIKHMFSAKIKYHIYNFDELS